MHFPYAAYLVCKFTQNNKEIELMHILSGVSEYM